MAVQTDDQIQSRTDEELCIDTLRALSVDMSYKANSGHPGAAMGLAPLFHVLFEKMRYSPKKDKEWINRDRFVLSNGHACALLYTILHLSGYNISSDDLKSFRQLHSITPGHPESTETPGIEVTTGPLGQGFANAVGLAIAQAQMATTYNRPGFPILDHKTYMVFGDGCAMEGIASEAASLAGHLKLGNLIAFYDDNHVCIDGSTDATFTEDVTKRFEAYGWHTQHVEDGDTDLSKIREAIDRALEVKDQPCLIKVTTTIGYGSLLAGTAACHGNPLKLEDIKQFRRRFNINPEPFSVPQAVTDAYQARAVQKTQDEVEWTKLYDSYGQEFPYLQEELSRRIKGDLIPNLKELLPRYTADDAAVASRSLSQKVLESIQASLPELVSGSADLTPSNNTRWKDALDFQAGDTKLGNNQGRYIRWGVREHAMGAAINGIAAYGANMIPAAGTFLNFVTYAAPAVRLAALSKLRLIWIATHDSIALGEDGPTHQPIETLAHFRAMPNINVWRPADGNETSAAYYSALTTKDKPSIIALTRQPLPQIAGNSIEMALKGAYVCKDVANGTKPALILVSTGSEVSICNEAADILQSEHKVAARVVSMPCQEVFSEQDADYQRSVLPGGVPILSVEALSRQGWQNYSHEQFGIDRFGMSGPAKKVQDFFEMTPQGVVKRALQTTRFYSSRSEIYSPLDRALD